MKFNICPDDNQICPFGATSYETCKTCKAQPAPEKPRGYTKKRISDQVRYTVLQRDNWTCCFCGSTENLTIDHILPESKGGQATIENCQVLCKSCNSRKGDQWPITG